MRLRLTLATAGVLALVAWLALVDRGAETPLGTAEEARPQSDAPSTEILPQPTAGTAALTPTPGRVAPPSRDAAESVFGCSLDDFFADPGLSEAEIEAEEERQHQARVRSLTASTDLEHRLAGLVLKMKDGPIIEELDALLAAMPEDPISRWLLLDACAKETANPQCRSGAAEARALEVLGANGEALASVAYLRLQRDDLDGALSALEQASAAAEMDGYWGKMVALLFHSLASVDNAPAVLRYFDAVGYIAARLPGANIELHRACRQRAADSSEWRRTCLAYGRRKEEKALTAMDKLLGIGLQRAIYQSAGDASEAAAAQAREERVLEPLLEGPISVEGPIVLAHDPSLVHDYLQEFAVYGEFAAGDFLAAEIERRAADPDYDPCPSTPPM